MGPNTTRRSRSLSPGRKSSRRVDPKTSRRTTPKRAHSFAMVSCLSCRAWTMTTPPRTFYTWNAVRPLPSNPPRALPWPKGERCSVQRIGGSSHRFLISPPLDPQQHLGDLLALPGPGLDGDDRRRQGLDGGGLEEAAEGE